MRLFPVLVITTLLSAPAGAAALQPDDARGTVQALIGELMNNVDWQLLLRIQQNLLNNLDLLVPYTEEYIGCLRSEGALAEADPVTLERLIAASKRAGKNCRVILESLAGKLHFDISAEELEQGLSPEYRKLLKESL